MVLGLAADAQAHEVGLSRGTYTIAGARFTVELAVSRREIASTLPELDTDRDGHIVDDELAGGRTALQKGVVDRIEVRSNGARCPGAFTEAHLVEGDGLVLQATYTCAAPIARARLDLPLLDDLAHGHRHIARSSSGVQVVETVMSRNQRTLELIAAPGATSAPAPPPPRSALALGVERMLTGYGHLVFLLALLLVRGSRRSLAWMIAAFTIACSLGLGLAALDVWVPRPAILEPAIALSIAYVGIENFFVKDAESRWRIAFPFGLVHGFGLATALRGLGVPRADMPVTLLLFNTGVDLGQLGVLAAALPVLALLRKQPWFERHGVRVASAGLVVIGLGWLAARVFRSS